MIALDATNVSAAYGDTQVLWGISLSVKRGQLVALIGANGAGKTTTLKTICGLVRPTAGTLRYEGTPAEVAGNRAVIEAYLGEAHA